MADFFSGTKAMYVLAAPLDLPQEKEYTNYKQFRGEGYNKIMDFKRPLEQRPVSDESTAQQQPAPAQAGSTKNSDRKRLIKKYWFIPVLVIALVAFIAYVLLQQYNTERKWDQATQLYDKAQYDKVAELVGDLPMPKDEERLTMYAQTMLATRDLDKALPAYESLQKKNPNPDTLVRIGNIYNEQKQYDKAIEVYQSVIDTNKSYVQAYVNLATVHRLQNRPDAAIATAKRAIEANPNSVVLHELYVSMLLDKQDSAEYKAAVAKLKELNPEDPLLRSLEQ